MIGLRGSGALRSGQTISLRNSAFLVILLSYSFLEMFSAGQNLVIF